MALRILLALAAFAVLYSCGQESAPAERQEQAAGVERSAPASDQQAHDAALQTYFDQMSTLLLDEGLSGWVDVGAKCHREVRTLARARTLAALERLDPARKRLVMQFTQYF
jgi:hypothetical protein